MKYTILTINDDRKAYKDKIRQYAGFDEIELPAFNAYEEDPVQGIKDRGLEWKPNWSNAKRGELGVWLSNYDRWAYVDHLGEPLIVFEDDAVIGQDFPWRFDALYQELPDDWDFVALWVPDNQRQDYLYNNVYDECGTPRTNGFLTPDESIFRIPGKSYAALVYQGYGMVSLMYSPNGGRKLVDLAHSQGIDGPVDCWLYAEAHKGNLNGYAPKPEHAEIVTYDWQAVSHVQLTEKAL